MLVGIISEMNNVSNNKNVINDSSNNKVQKCWESITKIDYV